MANIVARLDNMLDNARTRLRQYKSRIQDNDDDIEEDEADNDGYWGEDNDS